MSVSALMHWAWAQQVHPASSKFVLVTLACFATREWKACLSVPDLIEKTGLHRRAIFMALAQLKKLALIEPIGFYGPKKVQIYSVKGCKICTGRGAINAPVGVQNMHRGANMTPLNGSLPVSSPPPLTSSSSLPLFPEETPPLPPQGGNGQLLISELKPRKTKSSKQTEPSEDFFTFWDEYPRHVAMKAAWKAWEKSKPPLSIVLESLAEHKKSSQWRRGPEYIPHASTWINQERWDDEL